MINCLKYSPHTARFSPDNSLRFFYSSSFSVLMLMLLLTFTHTDNLFYFSIEFQGIYKIEQQHASNVEEREMNGGKKKRLTVKEALY